MPSVGAIVAAAGTGSRLGRGSKALVRLNGKTTLARVLELFLALDEVDRIVVVGPPSRLESAEREVAALSPRKPVIVKAGGESRQDSVRAGLAALGEVDFVLVHDAARPLATAALVRRVLAAAIETGAAFPAISPRDAVKRVDVHPLVAGRPLVLGGVRIDHPRGLDGHSDADVLTHAVIDALLGAAGMGDIGTLFPADDPRFKNASSIDMLRSAATLLARSGYR